MLELESKGVPSLRLEHPHAPVRRQAGEVADQLPADRQAGLVTREARTEGQTDIGRGGEGLGQGCEPTVTGRESVLGKEGDKLTVEHSISRLRVPPCEKVDRFTSMTVAP